MAHSANALSKFAVPEKALFADTLVKTSVGNLDNQRTSSNPAGVVAIGAGCCAARASGAPRPGGSRSLASLLARSSRKPSARHPTRPTAGRRLLLFAR